MKRTLILLIVVALSACAEAQNKIPTPSPTPSKIALKPVKGVEWKKFKPAPTERGEVAAVALGKQIYIMGGLAWELTPLKTVEVYDTESDQYSTGPDLLFPVHHAAGAALDGTIYLLGGYTGRGAVDPTDRAFALRSGRWEELPRMPEPRGAGGAAVVAGVIYVAGGVNPDGIASSVLSFNPASNSWGTLSAPLPTLREHLGVTSDDRRLYVVGGRTREEHIRQLTTVEAFDPMTGKWTTLPDMPTARGNLSATTTSNGFVVVPGGAPRKTARIVEAFDLKTGKWIALPPLSEDRFSFGVVAVETAVYVVAGGPEVEFAFSKFNEMIDLAPLR